MSYNTGGRIVSDGLVLYLDAANRKSYVSGSTVWRDLSGNNYSGSLINGPTFNSDNGGSIVFDGSNDYVLTNYSDNPSEITFELVVKPLNISTGTTKVFLSKSDASGFFYIGLDSSDSSLLRVGTQASNVDSNFIPANTSSFYFMTVVWGFGLGRSIYVNADYKNGISGGVTYIPSSVGGRLCVGVFGESSLSSYTAFALYSLKVYNRALSAEEVRQNYNATKKRFGL
jgi:hypothetical protein